jgi:hypothetical protein
MKSHMVKWWKIICWNNVLTEEKPMWWSNAIVLNVYIIIKTTGTCKALYHNLSYSILLQKHLMNSGQDIQLHILSSLVVYSCSTCRSTLNATYIQEKLEALLVIDLNLYKNSWTYHPQKARTAQLQSPMS